MKILFITPFLYYPGCGNGGGEICAESIRRMAPNNSIHVVSIVPHDFDVPDRAVQFYQSNRITLHLIKSIRRGLMDVLISKVKEIVGYFPEDADAFNGKYLRSKIRDISKHGYDLVVLQFPYAAQYIDELDGCTVVMDVQDVFFGSKFKHYRKERNFIKRLVKYTRWLTWGRYESFYYSKMSCLIAITQQDRSLLEMLVPEKKVFYVPAGVTIPDLRLKKRSSSVKVGFIGSFSHPPNLDALNWLLSEIVPNVVAKSGDFEFLIAGAGLPTTITSSLYSNVRFLGFVSDHHEFIQQCDLTIAPLRFGGGVKIKVLDSLAAGRCVIGTSVAFEGISTEENLGFFLANTCSEFVERLIEFSLLTDINEIAQAGRQFIIDNYSSDVRVKLVEKIFEKVILDESLAS